MPSEQGGKVLKSAIRMKQNMNQSIKAWNRIVYPGN